MEVAQRNGADVEDHARITAVGELRKSLRIRAVGHSPAGDPMHLDVQHANEVTPILVLGIRAKDVADRGQGRQRFCRDGDEVVASPGPGSRLPDRSSTERGAQGHVAHLKVHNEIGVRPRITARDSTGHRVAAIR